MEFFDERTERLRHWKVTDAQAALATYGVGRRDCISAGPKGQG